MDQDKMLQLVDVANTVRNYCDETWCDECCFTELCDAADAYGLGTLDDYFRKCAARSAIS